MTITILIHRQHSDGRWTWNVTKGHMIDLEAMTTFATASECWEDALAHAKARYPVF